MMTLYRQTVSPTLDGLPGRSQAVDVAQIFRNRVRVEHQRRGHMLVAHDLRHVHRLHTLVEQMAGERVPQVKKPEWTELRLLEHVAKLTTHPFDVQRLARLSRWEHVAVF